MLKCKINFSIDVNLKYETYCNAISKGSENEWSFGWSRYENSQVASEKSTLLSALSCSKDVWLLNRFLNMSLTSDSGVRKQDGYKVHLFHPLEITWCLSVQSSDV